MTEAGKSHSLKLSLQTRHDRPTLDRLGTVQMSDAPYPQYRIVTDHCNGYTVQIKQSRWRPWTTPWQISSRSTVEDAEGALAKYQVTTDRKIEVVKYLSPDAAPESPPMPSRPSLYRTYTPSLWCRIFGHKWVQYGFEDYWDREKLRHQRNTFQDRKHCDRCGVPNPNWTE